MKITIVLALATVALAVALAAPVADAFSTISEDANQSLRDEPKKQPATCDGYTQGYAYMNSSIWISHENQD